MRETDQFVASCKRSDQGRGLNLQARYVPLKGNQTHDPSVGGEGAEALTTDPH